MLEQLKASAGAGKTYALTRRFLDLLRRADALGPAGACQPAGPTYAWTDILAVTFTNKAAAEMKERVVRALKERALGLNDQGPAADWSPAQARQALETILAQYRQLNIRTIDSLLHALLRAFALDLGLPPELDVLFDPDKLFVPLYDRFLQRCEAGDAEAARLLDRCAESLLTLSGTEGFWLRSALGDALRQAFTLRLEADAPFETDEGLLLGRLEERHAVLRKATGSLSRAMTAARLDPVKHFENFLASCQAADPDAAKLDSTYAAKTALAECLKKGCHGRLADEHHRLFAAFRQELADFRRARAVYLGAARLAPFLAAADRLLEDLADLEREKGLAPAQTLPRRLAERLGGDMAAPEAFCRLGARLTHMLVDEFQDTSRSQWDVLSPLAEECLAKGGDLCLVGDVKQAIYGWRGGDCRLFDEIIEMGPLPRLVSAPQRASLPANWRSAPRLVRFFNAAFSPLADPDAASSLAGSLLGDCPPEAAAELGRRMVRAFAGCRQEIGSRRRDEPGRVRLQRLAGEDKDGLAEETRQALVRLIREDLAPRRRLADIAVLTRSNREAGLVARWLLEAGLPVVTEASLLLASHPLVRQLAAFLAFVDYPADGLAFWEFVTGQELFLDACGLDRDAMQAWLVAPPGPGQTESLPRRFRRDFPLVWERFVAPFLNQAGLLGPYDLTREAVRLYGVLERRPDDAIFVWRFLELLHASEEQGCVSAASFLELWRQSGGAEKIPLPEGVEAVRVMTMHKAKGLEWPVAIVPFHGGGDPNDKEPLPCLEDDALLLAPAHRDLGAPYWERQVSRRLEELNLLYVAWTRAASELHLFLPDGKRFRTAAPLMRAVEALLPHAGVDPAVTVFDDGEIRPAEAVPAAPLAGDQSPAAGATGADEAVSSPLAGPAAELASESEPAAAFSATAADGPASPEPAGRPRLMDWLPRLKIARNFAPASRRTESGPAARRGALVHRAMECLRPTGDAAEDARRALRAAMFEEGVGVLAAEEEADLLRPVTWAASRPELRPFLAMGRSEAELLAPDGTLRRVDRLAAEAGETVVLEYKTGQPDPDHARQLGEYLRLLAGAGRPGRGMIVYLDLERIDHVSLS